MAPEVETREQILDAAEKIIRQRGLTAATTREIAREAQCAEGSIYRHFPDKHALFVELVRQRYPSFMELMETLPEHAGRGNVEKTLEHVALSALEFYRGVIPLACGAMAEQNFLEQHRRYFDETGTGPLKAIRSLAAYLKREQRLGRISLRVSPDHTARVLLGACFAESFLVEFLGPERAGPSDEEFARAVVKSMKDALQPKKPALR